MTLNSYRIGRLISAAIVMIFVIFTVLLASPGPATAQDAPEPGTVFRDCETCPELVVVPAGLFVMGLGGKTAREGPPHRVIIGKSFAIGRYEVTFDQWQACRDDSACSIDPDDHKWGRGTRPVVNVNYKVLLRFVE